MNFVKIAFSTFNCFKNYLTPEKLEPDFLGKSTEFLGGGKTIFVSVLWRLWFRFRFQVH